MSHRLTRSPLFLSLLLLPFATGCVKRSTYRNALDDAQSVELGLRTDLQDAWEREEDLEGEIANLESQAARIQLLQ